MLAKKVFILVIAIAFLSLGTADKKSANSESESKSQSDSKSKSKSPDSDSDSDSDSVPDLEEELERCMEKSLTMQRKLVESKFKLSEFESKIELIKTLQNTISVYEKDLKAQEESNKFCQKVVENKPNEPSSSRKRNVNNVLDGTNCLSHGYAGGVKAIHFVGVKPFKVYCDGQTAGPGWAVIQQRINGSVDFYRSWKEYRNGFGNVTGEYFIGLKNLYMMTHYSQQELYIQLTDFNNNIFYARYYHFQIGNEAEKYKLKKLGKMEGSLANKLYDHLGHKFSTYDQDNDNSTSANLAVKYHSGWWFYESDTRYGCNLNGQYFATNSSDPFRLHWQWVGYKYVKMLIRPTLD